MNSFCGRCDPPETTPTVPPTALPTAEAQKGVAKGTVSKNMVYRVSVSGSQKTAYPYAYPYTTDTLRFARDTLFFWKTICQKSKYKSKRGNMYLKKCSKKKLQ